jgi:hypothetical protein
MIKETLTLLGKIDLTDTESIMLQDGDALEINVLRGSERMTLLNMPHWGGLDDEGERIPVEPLAIRIAITAGWKGKDETLSEKDHTEREEKLSPRRSGQRSKKLSSPRRVKEKS